MDARRRCTALLFGLLVVAGPLAADVTPANAAVILNVPAQYPTIKAALAAARTGDTIRISARPGPQPWYQLSKSSSSSPTVEAVELNISTTNKTGITIEGVPDASGASPTIRGTYDQNTSNDIFAIYNVDRVTIRNLNLVNAYEAVRVYDSAFTTLDNLTMDNSSMAVQFRNGNDNTIRNSRIRGTAVESGLYVYSSHRALAQNVSVTGSAREGVKVQTATGVRLSGVSVSGSKTHGVFATSAKDLSISSSTSSGNKMAGFYAKSSANLVLTGNTATANLGFGYEIRTSAPYTNAAQVTANNTGSANTRGLAFVEA